MADRYYLDHFLDKHRKAVVSGSEARHLLQVMRKKPGDTVILLNDDGWEYEGVIESGDKDGVLVKIDSKHKAISDPRFELVLLQGLCKGDKMDWIIQKTTELGVSRIVPVQTAHSEVRLEQKKADRKQQRWQEIARQATKQSRRATAPKIDPVLSLYVALDIVTEDNAPLIFLWEKYRESGMSRILSRYCESRKIILLVGPEGGFSEEESEAILSRKAQAATLGPRILRTETAAICAVSCIMYEKGELD